MPATPIFDLDEPPPAPRHSWLPKLIGGLLGAAIASLLILAALACTQRFAVDSPLITGYHDP